MTDDASPIEAPRVRSRRALLVAVCLPCVALALLGARLIENERVLEERRALESRQRTSDEMARAIVDQLQGIVRAEAVNDEAVYVDDATEFVATLDSSGLHLLPGRSARLASGNPAAFARLATDTQALAFVRGALGEPRIIAYDDGRLLVAPHYREHGPTLLVGVRTAPLVTAAGVALGDSIELLPEGRHGAFQLGYGIDRLWMSWREAPAIAGPWRGTRLYYVASLVVIGALGALGVYLIARDTQRESRVARLRQNFVAAVSHELKTPLTSIRVFAETLRDRDVPRAARDEYLATMVNETERLSRLVDNVLEFTRIERGDRVYRLAEGDVRDVVRRALGALEYPLAQRGFQVRVQCPDDLPPVRLDADAVEQVMLNLLTNAMKYSGGSREIEIGVETLEREIRIAVRDRGIGIPQSDRERIFERFYRSPSLSPEIAGTGLGLTVVHHVVAAHGGRVTVESDVGRGSTFNVFLPSLEVA